MIENQVSPGDKKHLKTIEQLINKVQDNSIIIWGALNFPHSLMDRVAEMVSNVRDREITFFAVEINKNILPILDEINKLHVLQVMDHLHLLDEEDIYDDILNKFLSCKEDNESVLVLYKNEKLNDRERRNIYIVRELRDRIKYPNVYREKQTYDINKIRYGGGRTGIDFQLYFHHSKLNHAVVSCQFTRESYNVFKALEEKTGKLALRIEKEVVFDPIEMKVYSIVQEYKHMFDKIDKLAELMELYIFYLSNYTFYYGRDNQEEMWTQHPEGLLE
ncbi:hypothetical protein [Halalkalibacter akibai]|uniref:Uncharacterized protein n=1 Tax=Halalkalibacter akibai (strain ATCC 43226 / DSM 21942 / CIP 109018 / JCM 9157 / 1139) TaxID=1236973 RepID=W4R1G0_HALA3|nr:hypothetical protein [Halalkalibacter akibai]GAE37389.1 hypothetical protein JCM9157_4666 [Halalkalibacter akibai JCM 9157]